MEGSAKRRARAVGQLLAYLARGHIRPVGGDADMGRWCRTPAIASWDT